MNETFTIVVATDLSDAGAYAFEQAVRLARRVPSAALHLVHVSRERGEMAARMLAAQIEAWATSKVASAGGAGGATVHAHVRHGEAAGAIIELATQLDADIVVIGRPRHPWMRAMGLGGIGEKVLLQAPCPVIFTGPKISETSLDGSPHVPPARESEPIPVGTRF